MNPEEQNWPQWKNYTIIFNEEDEDYSAIWGIYRDGSEKCLGTRWNTSHKGSGYPTGQGGTPQWLVAPDFLTLTILEKLLTISLERGLKNNKDEPFSNIITNTIGEFINQRQ